MVSRQVQSWEPRFDGRFLVYRPSLTLSFLSSLCNSNYLCSAASSISLFFSSALLTYLLSSVALLNVGCPHCLAKKHTTPTSLVINNETVEIVHTYKYLGFTVDDKLNWHEHCNELIKKINKRMYFFRKLKSVRLNNEV